MMQQRFILMKSDFGTVVFIQFKYDIKTFFNYENIAGSIKMLFETSNKKRKCVVLYALRQCLCYII